MSPFPRANVLLPVRVSSFQEVGKMKKIIFSTLMFVMLLSSEPAFSQVSIGIRIGAPPPPRVVYVVPRRPDARYVWVDGYWYPHGKKYKWHNGYWARPPYRNARWVAPRYERQRYFEGYWTVSYRR
jgi:hypothetical protein